MRVSNEHLQDAAEKGDPVAKELIVARRIVEIAKAIAQEQNYSVAGPVFEINMLKAFVVYDRLDTEK